MRAQETDPRTQRRRQRLAGIVEALRGENGSTIHGLAGRLGVSEMTIRRDLEELAHDGIVRLVHAGAVLAPEASRDFLPRYSLTEAGSERAEQKAAIGRAAAAMVADGAIAIIDSGSTTEWIARSLPAGLRATIICFALNVLLEVHRRDGCEVVFGGGTLHRNTLMFEGPESPTLVRRHRATIAFISATGVSDRLGVTCVNPYEVETKRAAIASALRRVLVADSSKFGRVQAAFVAELSDFDVVVTDAGIPPEFAQLLRARGIELRIA
jgi:DeoR family deoxyribose operon repressor